MNNFKKFICLIIFGVITTQQAFSVITDKDINNTRRVVDLIAIFDQVIFSTLPEQSRTYIKKDINTKKLKSFLSKHKFNKINEKISVECNLPAVLNETLAAAVNETDYTQEIIDLLSILSRSWEFAKIDDSTDSWSIIDTIKNINLIKYNSISANKSINVLNSAFPVIESIITRILSKAIFINASNKIFENNTLVRRISNVILLTTAEALALYIKNNAQINLELNKNKDSEQTEIETNFKWQHKNFDAKEIYYLVPIFVKNAITQVLGEVINKLLIASPEKQRHELFQTMVQENFKE
ncbi:hypothetical protein KJ644_00805 [Candidatus Dependentiae bacterium]|nr:hypothetical protein [Candidatus Dependentiae bacterium]MBU4386992.1 hypothetical protein [Candidatus Dependentiae bacterium]MCG2756112.1 hypothetical protein [Candidatus Dependentiae bacterium]